MRRESSGIRERGGMRGWVANRVGEGRRRSEGRRGGCDPTKKRLQAGGWGNGDPGLQKRRKRCLLGTMEGGNVNGEGGKRIAPARSEKGIYTLGGGGFGGGEGAPLSREKVHRERKGGEATKMLDDRRNWKGKVIHKGEKRSKKSSFMGKGRY